MGLNYLALSQADALSRWPALDARIQRTDSCWLWTGYRNERGYGRVWITGRLAVVHRVVYTALVGPIPTDLTLDHLCQNPSCCNPDHLEPVTNQVNIRRSDRTRASIGASRTHCPVGHPYDEANTIRNFRQGGWHRSCRTCQRRQNAESRTRRRATSSGPLARGQGYWPATSGVLDAGAIPFS